MKFFYAIAALAGILYLSILNISMTGAIVIGNNYNNYNNISLISPVNNWLYYKIKVKFNLSSDELLNEIKYANLMDTGARCSESERYENTCWKTLCTNCNGYGNDKERELTMNQGANKLVVRVIDNNSTISYHNVTILVESISPKIISTYPRENKAINGSNFTIVYTEYNLKSITLIYGDGVILEI